MQTLTEKRVFGTKSGTTEIFVASETGLVVVTVSADQIGEFGLAYRSPVSAVAAAGHKVVIGTDQDVLRSRREDSAADSTATAPKRTFEPVSTEPVGQVVAVGIGPTGLLAADSDGTVYTTDAGDVADAAKADDTAETTDTDANAEKWVAVGNTAGVRSIDRGLVAASDGVFRVTEAGLAHVGLSDVRDVAGHGTPLAATADGLFWLANGWRSVRDGSFDCVASDGHGHAHAVGPTGLIRHVSDETNTVSGGSGVDDRNWIDDDLPVDSPVIDIAYGGGIVAAVTADGTLCVDAGDGWRHQVLGVRGVNGLAVGPGSHAE